jgi:hypothetical protein
MRKSRLALLLSLCSVLFFTITGTACRKPGPQNVIRMSDLHTEKQLLGGFYALEAGAWRWTTKEFTVMLKVPDGATKSGGVLTLQGSVSPEGVQNGPLQIASDVMGQPLTAQSFSKPGEMIYRVDVPPSALTAPLVAAHFNLSNTHRVPGDLRDLGIIVSVIGLRAK